jgi:hypothetical protein
MKKLIQVFLSPASAASVVISEVYIDGMSNLTCTCPGWRGKHSCKHTRLIQERIDNNGGIYKMEVSKKATMEEAALAHESDEAFRKFVVTYGKIEVY